MNSIYAVLLMTSLSFLFIGLPIADALGASGVLTLMVKGGVPLMVFLRECLLQLIHFL